MDTIPSLSLRYSRTVSLPPTLPFPGSRRVALLRLTINPGLDWDLALATKPERNARSFIYRCVPIDLHFSLRFCLGRSCLFPAETASGLYQYGEEHEHHNQCWPHVSSPTLRLHQEWIVPVEPTEQADGSFILPWNLFESGQVNSEMAGTLRTQEHGNLVPQEGYRVQNLA